MNSNINEILNSIILPSIYEEKHDLHIYNMEKLDQAMTQMTAKLIAAGLTIHVATANGTQGEVASIDFADTRNDTTYRLAFVNEYDYSRDIMHILIFELLEYDGLSYRQDSTLWTNAPDTRYVIGTFYEINRHKHIYTDEDGIKKIDDIIAERKRNKLATSKNFLNKTYQSQIASILKHYRGYARIKSSDIIGIHKYIMNNHDVPVGYRIALGHAPSKSASINIRKENCKIIYC